MIRREHMHIRIRSEGGAEFRAPLTPPPTTLSLNNPPAQSNLLGKRIEVALGDDGWEKAIYGTVVRADATSGGMAFAFLDNGTVMGWGDEGVWGVRRAPNSEPYRDPNWQSPPFFGAPVSYGCVEPAFPSSPIEKPTTSWQLALVEEDHVVANACATTNQHFPHRDAIKASSIDFPTAVGPWVILPLSGTYDGKGGEWEGWIEDAERTWIAFLGRSGMGVVWQERGANGEVKGTPAVFHRDVATHPLFIAPRLRGNVKKIRSHRGIEIHIDRPMGTIIEGVDPDGKNYVFEQKCDYGFFPGTLGDDGDEFDVYLGSNPLAANVYIIEQLRARSGHWDERKAIVGCDSLDEALELYRSHVHPRMVGRIGTMTHAEFEQTLIDHQKDCAATKKNGRKPMVPVTHEDTAELAEMEALRAAIETTWAMVDESVKGGGGHVSTKADDVTNFPAKGDDKSVTLRNSNFDRFDVEWALDLKKKHPKVWDLGGNIRGNKQFDILSRVQKQGGSPHTAAEEAAIRLREPWAARHYEDFRPPGVVAQVKWLVVGKLGESKMKKLLNKEKDRVSKEATLDERAPISFIPPSDDFNPNSEPTSVPPVSSQPPSSVQATLAANEPSAVDPTMVIEPMPTANTNDVGPLSQRVPTIDHQTTMTNAIHNQIHRIILGTLALSAAGAIQLSADDRDSFRQYLAGDGFDPSGVSQHKDANPSRLPERTGPSAVGVKQRRVVELKAAADSIANIDVENREITFIASTPSVDSHGEVVAQDWTFGRFEKNPVILWAHNQREPPIGRAVKWWVENNKTLYIRVKFSQVYAFAQLIFDMIVEGTIRACSVGFIPYEITREEIDGQMRTVLRRNELCELSICPVPSNADAVIPKEIELAAERCAKAIEQKLAAITTTKQSPPPANGGSASTTPTTRGAPPAQATKDHHGGKGKAIMPDPIHIKEQVRRDGAITHRCGGCGDETQIQVPAIRERWIELEGRVTTAETERSIALRAAQEEKEKRAQVEQAHAELQVKFTQLELAPLTGPDLWNISPARVRELAELRQRSGEEAYAAQLSATREGCKKIKDMADDLVRLKNAPAVPPTVSQDQTPVTVVGQGAPAAPTAPAPVAKTADPVSGWLNS